MLTVRFPDADEPEWPPVMRPKMEFRPKESCTTTYAHDTGLILAMGARTNFSRDFLATAKQRAKDLAYHIKVGLTLTTATTQKERDDLQAAYERVCAEIDTWRSGRKKVDHA